MENLFYSFLDELSVFLCVANLETHEIIYCNTVANCVLVDKSDAERVAMIHEIVQLEQVKKHCSADRDGCWFQMRSKTCTWLDGETRLLIVGLDCSTNISNEELLAVAAYTDSLTGIYSRRLGTEMLTKFIEDTKAGTAPFTLCFFDLDDLKYVNDNFGHQAGDQYLLSVVDLIKQSIRLTDIFARMGGDEFLILFPKCQRAIVENIMSGVMQKMKMMNNANTPKTHYSISYGIIEVSPGDTRDMGNMLHDADEIMYKMKAENKKNRQLPLL